MITEQDRPPLPALAFGFAGLLPPAGLLAAALLFPGFGWAMVAVQLVLLYAGLIFSFLGGAWWAFASRREAVRTADLLIAVAPSLIAFAALALSQRTASGLALALAIAASPLIDRGFVRQGLAPSWWTRLRVPLSLGLAAFTAAATLL